MGEFGVWTLAAIWIGFLALHFVSIVGAAVQPMRARRSVAHIGERPVTIIVPLHGAEPELAENLDRIFVQDYPRFRVELAFAREDDAAASVGRAAAARHPGVESLIRIGESTQFVNPKVRNEFKCLEAASTDFVYIVDSNVSLPSNALRRSMAIMAPDTGLVAGCPIAVRPTDWVGELELAFINGYGARFLLAGAALGLDANVGKSMLIRWTDAVRRSVTEEFGRVASEDTAILFGVTKLGLRARLSDGTVDHPVGARRWDEFWSRQVRWVMSRQSFHPGKSILEVVGSLPFVLIYAAGGASALGLSAGLAMGMTLAFWYCAEWLLVWRKAWPFDWRTPIATVARDCLFPVIRLAALFGQEAVWKETRIRVGEGGTSKSDEPGKPPLAQ